MTYTISLISAEENERLSQRYLPLVRYEIKSEIYGCCIKLLCDDHALKDTWEDNFYSMSQNVRSHGRLFVVKDTDYPPDTVLFDPHAKTAFLMNIRYYGWIKSIALSLAGDILEDEHGIWSVHGACVDVDGKGICIVGAPGSGKTTQTYGLLTQPRTRMISFTETGTPCRGPRSTPARKRDSAARAASMAESLTITRKAFKTGFRRSQRRRWSSTTSTGEICFSRYSRASSKIPRVHRSSAMRLTPIISVEGYIRGNRTDHHCLL